MGFSVVTSAAGLHRIALARDWLGARAPAEEILIIGASLGAANELARSLAQEKRASFGYHRLTFAQLASALALRAQPRIVATTCRQPLITHIGGNFTSQ